MAAKPVQATKRTPAQTSKKEPAKSQNFFQQLWANQTQLSFILGALVVIIVAILLFQFFNTANPLQPQQVANTVAPAATITTNSNQSVPPTVEPRMTTSPSASATSTPTVAPKVTATAQATATPKASAQAQATPSTKPAGTNGAQYTVQAGDTLWQIAETRYGTGFAWKEIAKANNITEGGMITTGTVLNLPTVDSANLPKTTMQAASTTQPQIPAGNYTIQKGDTLWKIAQGAYSDPYKWPRIAEANNLTSPSLIHVGNTIKIPPAQ